MRKGVKYSLHHINNLINLSSCDINSYFVYRLECRQNIF